MSRQVSDLACTSVETPLSKSSPQLEIRDTSLIQGEHGTSFVRQREYRVYNYRKLRTSGQIIRRDGWGLFDAVVLGGLVWAATICWWGQSVWSTGQIVWARLSDEVAFGLCIPLFMILYIKTKCSVVLYECVTAIPAIGVQLSVTKGISLPSPLHLRNPRHRVLIPLSTSYTMVPLSDISTVSLNQGLSRFSVQHYLGIVQKEGRGIVLALDATRPGFEVLKEVYHGLREIMFHEFSPAHKLEGHRERVE